MKGAVDDVDGIIALLKEMSIQDFHIHCDMALSGMILPFVKGAPQINFTKEIGSLAISGHKYNWVCIAVWRCSDTEDSLSIILAVRLNTSTRLIRLFLVRATQ